MATSDQHPFAAAAVTPKLIDREEILDKLAEAVAGTGSPVFYLTGRGGNGKTFLLREFLRRIGDSERAQRDLWVAWDVVDFYHTHNHTPQGLCRTIVHVLEPTPGYFDRFKDEQETLEEYLHDLSTGHDVSNQREATIEAFRGDFRNLTGEYRVVLAFDTAELLLYEADPIQRVLQKNEELRIEQPELEARDLFLNNFLPELENSVILIAGRPELPQLEKDLRKALGDRLVKLNLGPLEEEDSLAYFDAVAEGARRRGALEVAERVEEIPEDVRRVIHRYVGGRPILLSLVLDYLTVTDRLLPALRRPLAEVEKLRKDELRAIQQDLEGEIVRSIQETGRRADDTIRKLAWARRGLDVPMLAWLMGFNQEDAKERLDEVLGLSFVKVRPDDNRVFLQDEMYDLLQRHTEWGAPELRLREYSSLESYYSKQINETRHSLRALQEQPDVVAGQLGRLRLRLQNAIVERVHYQLQLDPKSGFEAYYRAAEEAFQSRHLGMDLQLREEMLTFLYKRARPEARAQIEDLVIWDAGVRWIKRHIAQLDYTKAIKIAERLRVEQSERMELLGTLAEMELNLWEAHARTFAAQDLELADRLFRTSIEWLDRFQASDQFDDWRRTHLLADAYNNWGYLLRIRGAFDAAAENYGRALRRWRELKKGADADHANTLNNLAFAMGEIGEFDQALRVCRDGLEMREELGPRYPVALSLNTMAMIQIRNDQPHRAEVMADRALAIFERLGSQRGIGMAYRALAEALRRQAEVQGQYTISEQRAKLEKAEEYAEMAVSLFSRKVREQGRLVESLIERGCIFRNLARIWPASEAAGRARVLQNATRSLERAVEEAGKAFPHLKMDALVNLAWHQYYLGNPPGALSVLENEVFPLAEEYQIKPGVGVPNLETPVTFFWVQLGKASSLLGQIEMATFHKLQREQEGDWQQRADACLREATRHYTLAIAYDQLFGRDFREMRRGLDLIYDELKRLNARELGVVHSVAKQTQDECCLRKPCRMLVFMKKSFGLPESLDEVASDLDYPRLSRSG